MNHNQSSAKAEHSKSGVRHFGAAFAVLESGSAVESEYVSKRESQPKLRPGGALQMALFLSRKLLQLSIERASFDPEDRCRATLVAVGVTQDTFDVQTL